MPLPTTVDLGYLALVAVLDGVALLAWRRRMAVLASACLLAGVAVIPALGENLFMRLRLLAWQVFLHLPLVLLAWAAAAGWRRRAARLAVAAAIALAVLALDAFVVEPRALEVRRLRIVDDRVPRALRVVLVADLQADTIGDYERHVLERVLAAAPDLVLLAGDYVQAPPSRRAAEEAALNDLLRDLDFGAPLGAFAVEGNAEDHGRDWPRLFAGTGVTPLTSRTTLTPLPGLSLTALTLRESFASDLIVPAAPGYHLVLGHAPDYALGRIDANLLLAGHTHGGQVRLPLLGPLLTLSRVPRAWAAGVTALPHGRTLVVSRGIGMERGYAPRLRFNCRPEIVIIDLVPAHAERPSGGDEQDRAERQHETR
ncbi:MAG: metallophosphoesterase [Gammaproteobacteria bacterium]